MEVVATTGAISGAKLQSIHHHQQTNTQFFYRPDALSVAQPTVSKHLGTVFCYCAQCKQTNQIKSYIIHNTNTRQIQWHMSVDSAQTGIEWDRLVTLRLMQYDITIELTVHFSTISNTLIIYFNDSDNHDRSLAYKNLSRRSQHH